MTTSFVGIIEPHVVEARFAYSGKLVYVKKKAGDTVKQWEVIASLDRKMLQAELDRQLADYERVRAEFELFNIKYGQDGDDTTKFLRQQKQAALNISVKDVEIAKYKLDQADLISPVNGTILNTNGLVAGLHITPANSAIQILQTDSHMVAFTIEQKNLEDFLTPQTVSITFPGIKKEYEGATHIPYYGRNGTFTITVILKETIGLLPGMKGKVTIKQQIKTSSPISAT